MFFGRSLISLLAFCLLSLPTTLWAASSEWQRDEDVAVRLISAQNSIDDQETIMLGLEVKLAPGVHTYWRSPGLAGSPPRFDWYGSQNIKDAEILYPAPIRFGMPPFDAIGYEEHVIFPLHITPIHVGHAINIVAKLDLLLCKGICIPKQYDLWLPLPTINESGEDADDSPEYDLIKAAMEKLPRTADQSSLEITDASKTEDRLIFTITSNEEFNNPDIFIEHDKEVLFQGPEIKITSGGHDATITIPFDADEPFALSDLTVTLVDAPFALTQKLDQPNDDLMPFWCVLLLAVIGGFILNLMPCVLPVLSLKIFSLIRHGQESAPVIRRAFLSTASGIIFSFFILACAMIALKASGQAVGWGVHFQQPLFLTFMVVVLTFFAANLWGFYEVGMPRIIQTLIDPERNPKLSGDFANGALATMLATPCSAPFLGTAISFALAAGWLEIMSVFLALGLGMAAPYLLIAAQPTIAQHFPSPGAWMKTLSRVLGFALAGTALWLLLVLVAQIGNVGAGLIGIAMLAMMGMMVLRHRKVTPLITYPAFTIILLFVFGLALVATTPNNVAPENGLWHSFDEGAIEQNVLEGKTVFVDVTADWCLTCKVNKRFALANQDVTDRLFHSNNIVAMQGNWTNPDPVITAFLHKYGRYGVPFNIVFSPEHPEGFALPELLTTEIVLKALEKSCEIGSEC